MYLLGFDRSLHDKGAAPVPTQSPQEQGLPSFSLWGPLCGEDGPFMGSVPHCLGSPNVPFHSPSLRPPASAFQPFLLSFCGNIKGKFSIQTCPKSPGEDPLEEIPPLHLSALLSLCDSYKWSPARNCPYSCVHPLSVSLAINLPSLL